MENAMIGYRGFALRKIPSTLQENSPEIITDGGIDKIKILELSTAIDNWEQEVLFSENGFYSLKGTDVEDKVNEFIGELKSFIESKISEMSFTLPSSRELAHKIKLEKIKAVETQMLLYSQEQLNEWEISTYENAIDSSIKRAVFYKNNPEVILSAFQNGLKIVDIISEKEDWNKKLQTYRKKQFVSDFHLALVKAFINDNNINAYHYFNKYKNNIDIKDKDKIEKQVNEMRINITAINWSKEIFSYQLDEKDFEKELNDIKDEDIKISAKRFYNDLKKSEKRQKLLEEKEKNIQNWKEIIDYVKNDIDKAVLFIDYSLNKESIKSKKDYINQMREFGSVNTDKKEFLTLWNEIFNNFQSYREKDLSNYRGCLKNDDFEIFEQIQKYSDDEFIKLDFDFKYAQKLIKEKNIKNDEDKYDLIKIYLVSINEYNSKKGENLDTEKRTKLIDTMFARLKK